jgi:hypothetical protein
MAKPIATGAMYVILKYGVRKSMGRLLTNLTRAMDHNINFWGVEHRFNPDLFRRGKIPKLAESPILK